MKGLKIRPSGQNLLSSGANAVINRSNFKNNEINFFVRKEKKLITR